MVTRGLLVGRFQPPHLGHLDLIKHALKEVDELIIAIAAAQISHTKKNPMTAGERVTMMRLMLKNSYINPSSYWVIPTQDIMDNALWVTHLKRLLPDFQIFFGNNPFTEMLFSEAGIETRSTPMFSREKYEASHIRNMLIEDKNIDGLVDKDVQAYLKQINIRKRLMSIVTDDSSNGNKSIAGSELQDL